MFLHYVQNLLNTWRIIKMEELKNKIALDDNALNNVSGGILTKAQKELIAQANQKAEEAIPRTCLAWMSILKKEYGFTADEADNLCERVCDYTNTQDFEDYFNSLQEKYTN